MIPQFELGAPRRARAAGVAIRPAQIGEHFSRASARSPFPRRLNLAMLIHWAMFTMA